MPNRREAKLNKLNLTLNSLILILIIFQSFVFTFFLFKKRNKAFYTLLGILTLIFGLHFLNVLIIEFTTYRIPLNLNPIFSLFYGPLFYLFVIKLTQQKKGPIRKHFLIILLCLLLIVYFQFFLAIDISNNLTIPIIIQLGYYLILVLKEIKKFESQLKENFASIDKLNLKWINNLFSQFFILFLVLLINTVFQFIGAENIQVYSTFLIFSFSLYFINSLVFKSLTHPEFELVLNSEKYSGSNLNSEKCDECIQTIISLFETEKIYSESDLKISHLAEKTGFSTKHISQAINQKKSLNFYDFVNQFRIEEAKNLLSDQQSDYRINEIMDLIGYKNRSTFNTVFKKQTGFTPSEYKKKSSNP